MDRSAIFQTHTYLKGHPSLRQPKLAKGPRLTIPNLTRSPLLLATTGSHTGSEYINCIKR